MRAEEERNWRRSLRYQNGWFGYFEISFIYETEAHAVTSSNVLVSRPNVKVDTWIVL
jgi:hypothetical protein